MAWDTENAWRPDWHGRWRSHKPGQALVEQNVARPLLRVRNTGTTEQLRLVSLLKPRLAQSSLPGGACIVGMASMSSLFGIELAPGYGAAKTGLVGLTRVLAVRYAKDNIRVNAIACGVIESKMTEAMLEIPEMVQSHLERTPLKRLGKPLDIAGPTLFLTSPAAQYMTGQTMVVDGGFSIQG